MRRLPPSFRPALAVLCTLALATAAHAQLKPSKEPRTPAATATPAAPSADAQDQGGTVTPEIAAKVQAAGLAAQGWLTLLDRGDWGTAWETAASMFRGAVPLANWMDGIPKVRSDLGAFAERTQVTADYKTGLPGRPPGDYVTLIFDSRFQQRRVDEVVTTVLEPDGRWRVTGYSTR